MFLYLNIKILTYYITIILEYNRPIRTVLERFQRDDGGWRPGGERSAGYRSFRRNGMDQLSASDDGLSAWQGGADRLLDLLLHQLSAYAALHQGLEREVQRQRPGDHRRPHARVSLRER